MFINFDYNNNFFGSYNMNKIQLPEDHEFNPHICIMNISSKQISAFVKSKIENIPKEYENKHFYPIGIKQNGDLSFEIIFGVLE